MVCALVRDYLGIYHSTQQNEYLSAFVIVLTSTYDNEIEKITAWTTEATKRRRRLVVDLITLFTSLKAAAAGCSLYPTILVRYHHLLFTGAAAFLVAN